MIETLTIDIFTPYLHTDFEVTVGEYDEVLTLFSATPSRHPSPAPLRQSFSLIFHGSRNDLHLNHQILSLRHPKLGTLEISLSPTARLPDGTFEYEAAFN